MANVVTNPGFETPGGGDPDFFASWTESTNGSSTIDDETTAEFVHGGSSACKLSGGGGGLAQIRQEGVSVVGKTYHLTFWARTDGASRILFVFFASGVESVSIVNDTYTQYSLELVAADTWLQFRTFVSDIYLDDIEMSVKEVLSIDGTDIQNIGDIIVKTPGKGINGRQINDDNLTATDTTDISTNYDDRFDDPRYYDDETP